MAGPVLVAVDDDPESLRAIESELRERYARDYTVVCEPSPGDALAKLESLAADGAEVALVLAGQWLAGMTGGELLTQGAPAASAREARPPDRMGRLGRPGHRRGDLRRDGARPDRLLRAAALRRRRTRSSTRPCRASCSSGRTRSEPRPHTIHVVGESWSGRAYELRDVLERCAIPHAFCLADSDKGRELLAGAGENKPLPLIVLPDGQGAGRIRRDAEIAFAAGAAVDPRAQRLRRGDRGLPAPPGLSAAVYGASEGLTRSWSTRAGIGGQATSSSLIRNYLGFPRGVSGGRLVGAGLRAGLGPRRELRAHAAGRSAWSAATAGST